MNIEQIEKLIEEAGPIIEPELIQYQEGGYFVIVLPDKTVLELEYDEPQRKLCISTELGNASPERRARTYEAMLCYNSLWASTGGVKLALDGPDGIALLCFDWHVTELSVAALCSVLTNFQQKAVVWRNIFAEGGFAEEADDQNKPHPEHLEFDKASAVRI